VLIVPQLRLVYFSLRCQQSQSYARLKGDVQSMLKRRGHDHYRAREQSQHEACPRSRSGSMRACDFPSGIQSVLCFIVAFIVYGHQPQVGASADALADFYEGDRMRILIMAVLRRGSSIPCGSRRRSGRLADAGQDRLARGGDRLRCLGVLSSCSSRWSQPSRTPSPAAGYKRSSTCGLCRRWRKRSCPWTRSGGSPFKLNRMRRKALQRFSSNERCDVALSELESFPRKPEAMSPDYYR
jgi:hypothetical protein